MNVTEQFEHIQERHGAASLPAAGTTQATIEPLRGMAATAAGCTPLHD